MPATKSKTSKKKAPAKTTHLAFVVDESGSMQGNEASVVDGYNEFITTMMREGADEENTICTLAFFDKHADQPHVRVHRDRVPLNELPELAHGDYRPRGMTPLNDAVADVIGRIGNAKKKKDQAMVIIVTDGAENSSELSTTDLRELVNAKETDGWEFIYLAANVDAFASARNIGMKANAGSYYNFSGSSRGTSNSMKRAASVGSTYSTLGSEAVVASTQLLSSDIPDDEDAFAAQEQQLQAAKAEFVKAAKKKE